ncbi:unnamed protein product [Rhizophagus irregularis]|nr:unnamed protein product [Rhizophagus irregularis]
MSGDKANRELVRFYFQFGKALSKRLAILLQSNLPQTAHTRLNKEVKEENINGAMLGLHPENFLRYLVTLVTFALCKKEGSVGVTGLENTGVSTDGVTGLDTAGEFSDYATTDDSLGDRSDLPEEELDCRSFRSRDW